MFLRVFKEKKNQMQKSFLVWCKMYKSIIYSLMIALWKSEVSPRYPKQFPLGDLVAHTVLAQS